MQTLEMINGNGHRYTKDMPLILILNKFNEVALKNLENQTGLNFEPYWEGYKAQPTNSEQILKLFLTYNFKSRYYNNATYKNTLMLKRSNEVNFELNNVCEKCVKRNYINVGNDLEPDDYRLWGC